MEYKKIDYSAFSLKLKSIRLERDVKQEDIAKLLKVSTNTYMSYENDPKNMKLNIFMSIGDILDIDIVNIFLQCIAPKCSKE